ncbi:MAG: ChbG/HpnK family deacetylase, partial [Bacteroidales bacterium]|nr:ChbG/HpnK family deacetylase [Bacteroidales bacterium]
MKISVRTNYISGLLAIFITSLIFTPCINGQDKNTQADMKTTWAEKLGYPAGKKVIILHADDAGMSEGANIATAHYLENKYIQSAAIMAPCPAADEFILWAIDHPDADVGMHLTHTSEWKTYRWGPVSDPAEVPGLIDPEGMLWHEVPDVVRHASADEIEKEI